MNTLDPGTGSLCYLYFLFKRCAMGRFCIDKFCNTPVDMYSKANAVLCKFQKIDIQSAPEPSNV